MPDPCQRYRDLISRLKQTDDEFSDETYAEMDDHVAACPDCRDHLVADPRPV